MGATWKAIIWQQLGASIDMLENAMRHVQHHAAQLNLILRQKIDSAPGWVSRTKKDSQGILSAEEFTL